MFVPVVDAVGAATATSASGDPDVDAVLVNRFYLRGVEQVDKRTGEKAQKLPGAAAGRHQLAGPLVVPADAWRPMRALRASARSLMHVRRALAPRARSRLRLDHPCAG